MSIVHDRVTIIGAGLAGCEAAWQLAARGVPVRLVEMRPKSQTPAHSTGVLAELVCSNSFKSLDPSAAAGALKRDLRILGSLLMRCAADCAVPAGAALAVDRIRFSAMVEAKLTTHPLIQVAREEAVTVPEGRVIIATGPLTSDAMQRALSDLIGESRLSFFDAAAPVVAADSLDRSVVFAASRYGKGEGADYLNAPMTREEYEAFHAALVSAERVTLRDFERRELFAACQPVEEVARTGEGALRFGALKPVGLTDPRTGERPWAVVQLRAENLARTAYNLVGFQTNLTFPEQRRVFGMVPGLQAADWLRFGVMHRNTFVDAPRLLDSGLRLRAAPRIRLAGQITGTEGYTEAVASGLLAGVATYADLLGLPAVALPHTTVFGALVDWATDPSTCGYQPQHVNYGLVPALDQPNKKKRDRYEAYSNRSRDDLLRWIAERPELLIACNTELDVDGN